MTIYEEKGFKDRKDYLKALSENFDFDSVMALSELLGPEEDFDGLIFMLEDMHI